MTFQWIAGDLQTPIVELRRYAMQPGRTDDFIDLFETRFIEQQEAVARGALRHQNRGRASPHRTPAENQRCRREFADAGDHRLVDCWYDRDVSTQVVFEKLNIPLIDPVDLG